MQARDDIIALMKKRDKLNNSALAQIETTGNSRKFTQSQGQTQNATSKIYSQKVETANNQTEGTSRSQQKARRQLSNTEKGVSWSA